MQMAIGVLQVFFLGNRLQGNFASMSFVSLSKQSLYDVEILLLSKRFCFAPAYHSIAKDKPKVGWSLRTVILLKWLFSNKNNDIHWDMIKLKPKFPPRCYIISLTAQISSHSFQPIVHLINFIYHSSSHSFRLIQFI